MNPSKEQVLQQLDAYFGGVAFSVATPQGTPMSLAGRSQIKDRGALRFALDHGADLAMNQLKLSTKH